MRKIDKSQILASAYKKWEEAITEFPTAFAMYKDNIGT